MTLPHWARPPLTRRAPNPSRGPAAQLRCESLEDRSVPSATTPRLLQALTATSLGGPPDLSVVAGGYLFFTATDGVHGRELWRSDGTADGTMMLADLSPGA